MLIQTERLLLRGWTAGDLPAHRKMSADVGYTCFTIPGYFCYRDEVELQDKVTKRARQFAETGFGKYLVFERGSDSFVGTCGVEPFDAQGAPPIHELGYRLMLQHWGKGYATEAAAAVMRHYFEVMRQDTLHAFALPQNAASLKILAKLGFDRCGWVTFNGIANHLFATSRKLGK